MNEPILNLQAEFAELAAIEAESIGWLPLGDGARFKDWLNEAATRRSRPAAGSELFCMSVPSL